MNEYMTMAAPICNAAWPIFSVLLAVGIGLKIMEYLQKEIRDAFDSPHVQAQINKPWSETYKLLKKRKNEEEIGLALDRDDLEIEKPKVTGWTLGDDGEMIPVLQKRKNDDMFHQN